VTLNHFVMARIHARQPFEFLLNGSRQAFENPRLRDIARHTRNDCVPSGVQPEMGTDRSRIGRIIGNSWQYALDELDECKDEQEAAAIASAADCS
jgi:hypothetical protein